MAWENADRPQNSVLRWDAQTNRISRLLTPTGGQLNGHAFDASASGSVIVGSFSNGIGRPRAMRWTVAGAVPLSGVGDDSSRFSYATGVSADGTVIVGRRGLYPNGEPGEVYRWQNGQVQIIGPAGRSLLFSTTGAGVFVSADGSVIASTRDAFIPPLTFLTDAFRWENGTLTTLNAPGTRASEATDLSADGSTLVGVRFTNTGQYQGFRWGDADVQNTAIQVLTPLPGYQIAIPRAVSADGSIIVGGLDPDGIGGFPATDAFIWDQTHGMRKLRDVLLAEDPSLAGDLAGWNLDEAVEISPDGSVIVGIDHDLDQFGSSELWRVQRDTIRPPTTNISVVSFEKNNRSFNPLYPLKYSNGNYDLTYRVTGDILPDDPNLTLAVYWASGPELSDIISGRAPVATGRVLRDNIHDYVFSIKMYNLIDPPSTATHLLAVLDNGNVFSETNEIDNVAVIGPDELQENLSYELDSIAPTIGSSRTREQRVFLWLGQYSQDIKATAAKFQIDPRAIAGAIAWEAIYNKTPIGSIFKFYGPGKIHYDETDAIAVQGTNKYGNYLPVQKDLAAHLKDPINAITYITAIMNAYAVEASAVGINLRGPGSSNNKFSNASILATYYNGAKFNGRQISLLTAPKYFRERIKTISSNPLSPNDTMGQWVENNLDYLDAALT